MLRSGLARCPAAPLRNIHFQYELENRKMKVDLSEIADYICCRGDVRTSAASVTIPSIFAQPQAYRLPT